MEQKLLVGYARVDITPEQYTNMGGNGLDAKRMSNEVLERIFGTCIAITDAQGQSVLYCPIDTLYARAWFSVPARAAMSAVTGVPVENIMLCASHSHSGPAVSSPGLETMQLWGPYFIRQMTKCAKEAMEDRKPATMSIGQRQVPGMTFVRHYHMHDGTIAGPNSGSFESGAKAHLTEGDDTLQVVRFTREGGRDVVMVNWQCHATSAGWVHEYAIQGDYIYSMRNHLEGLTGTYFGFFQGAAGNLVCSSKIKGETRIPSREFPQYGRVLAEEVIACLEEMTPAASGNIQGATRVFQEAIDHSDDELLPKAKAALERFLEYSYEQQEEATKRIREEGFNSHLHAQGICNRFNLEKTMSMELWAHKIGNVGFIAAPYEMFCSSGRYIKEHSPFAMTFVVSCTNDSFGYMPDDMAFDYDIYEINTRRYSRGSAERLAQTFVDMLNELKK